MGLYCDPDWDGYKPTGPSLTEDQIENLRHLSNQMFRGAVNNLHIEFWKRFVEFNITLPASTAAVPQQLPE